MRISISKDTLIRIATYLVAYATGVTVVCLLNGKISIMPFIVMGLTTAFIVFSGKKKAVKTK